MPDITGMCFLGKKMIYFRHVHYYNATTYNHYYTGTPALFYCLTVL